MLSMSVERGQSGIVKEYKSAKNSKMPPKRGRIRLSRTTERGKGVVQRANTANRTTGTRNPEGERVTSKMCLGSGLLVLNHQDT